MRALSIRSRPGVARRRWICPVWIMLTILGHADLPMQTAAVLDLPTAIQLALLQNRDLKQTVLAVESSGYSVTGAEAEFSYRIHPDGTALASDATDSYGYALEVARKFSAGTDVSVRGGYSEFSTEEQEDKLRRSSVRLQVSQPLFRNFGTLVNREPVVRAERQVLTIRRLLERQKSDLVLDVVRAYEDLIRLESQIGFDEQFFNRVDRLYALTRARERQGQGTRVDTLRVELQRGQALSRLENNRERLASRRLDFADLLGMGPEAVFGLAASPLIELDVPDRIEARGVAFSNRLDLAQSLQDQDDAERGIRIARRDLLPSLRLVSRIEQFGEGDTVAEIFGFDDTSWAVGLEADTELVRQRERATLQQRALDAQAARWDLEILRDAIIREIDQSLLAYERTRRELDIAESNRQLAADRVRLARRLFEVGRGDNFSVTDAEDALLAAQQQTLVTRADASFTGYQVLHTLGTLVAFPADLIPAQAVDP